jgi:integrase
MVVFATATGLRPSELLGLEQHDVDREAGVIYVRRAFANGRVKHTKTRLSTRAVPLQAKAFEALDRLPALVNPILFPKEIIDACSSGHDEGNRPKQVRLAGTARTWTGRLRERREDASGPRAGLSPPRQERPGSINRSSSRPTPRTAGPHGRRS